MFYLPILVAIKTSPITSPRRQLGGGGDENDFLKMLGKTSEKDTTNQTEYDFLNLIFIVEYILDTDTYICYNVLSSSSEIFLSLI